MPHRADGMNDVLCGQLVTLRDLRVAGMAAIQGRALVHKFAAGCAMNGAIDAAPSHEGGVGGVDDGVDCEGGEVGAEGAETSWHGEEGSSTNSSSSNSPKSKEG